MPSKGMETTQQNRNRHKESKNGSTRETNGQKPDGPPITMKCTKNNNNKKPGGGLGKPIQEQNKKQRPKQEQTHNRNKTEGNKNRTGKRTTRQQNRRDA